VVVGTGALAFAVRPGTQAAALGWRGKIIGWGIALAVIIAVLGMATDGV
jgi:glycerol uptake facilitator-like aquaporin